jgi:hypothetical protein
VGWVRCCHVVCAKSKTTLAGKGAPRSTDGELGDLQQSVLKIDGPSKSVVAAYMLSTCALFHDFLGRPLFADTQKLSRKSENGCLAFDWLTTHHCLSPTGPPTSLDRTQFWNIFPRDAVLWQQRGRSIRWSEAPVASVRLRLWPALYPADVGTSGACQPADPQGTRGEEGATANLSCTWSLVQCI